MLAIIVLAACFLAYSNGANDNMKGAATLIGSRTASYKSALILGQTQEKSTKFFLPGF